MTDFSSRPKGDILVLFDVDGTLSPARLRASAEMIDLLRQLRKKYTIGFVGGSNLPKQEEQLAQDGQSVIYDFDYCFSENGLTAFKSGKPLASETFINFVGEERYKKLANFILHYVADLDIPVKRGTFIEFRTGMINVSPVGRNASNQERNEFEQYDQKANVRKQFIEVLKKQFPDLGMTYSIGGQISFDVFPTGWDKTYCLRHVEKEGFKEIHFFGDKTFPGGNDYEIYSDSRVKGHSVKNPEETMKILREEFLN